MSIGIKIIMLPDRESFDLHIRRKSKNNSIEDIVDRSISMHYIFDIKQLSDFILEHDIAKHSERYCEELQNTIKVILDFYRIMYFGNYAHLEFQKRFREHLAELNEKDKE